VRVSEAQAIEKMEGLLEARQAYGLFFVDVKLRGKYWNTISVGLKLARVFEAELWEIDLVCVDKNPEGTVATFRIKNTFMEGEQK
jgi:hypothetical protein